MSPAVGESCNNIGECSAPVNSKVNHGERVGDSGATPGGDFGNLNLIESLDFGLRGIRRSWRKKEESGDANHTRSI